MDSFYENVISKENLVISILYGSRKDGSDIDIFSVYSEEPLQVSNVFGRFDLLNLGFHEVESLIQNLDPLVTEPIIQGELIIGQHDIYTDMRESLHGVKSNSNSVQWLFNKSIEYYIKSHTEYIVRKRNLVESQFKRITVNLGFSFSYFSFAKYYDKCARNVISLHELLNNPEVDLVKEFFRRKTFFQSNNLENRKRYLDELFLIFRNKLLH